MPIYKIIREETIINYLFVEAGNEDEAAEIASEIDAWKTGKYDCQEDSPVEATPEDLIGEFIHNDEDGYDYHAAAIHP